MGYVHTVVKQIEEGGRQLLDIDVDTVTSVQRFGDQTAPGIRLKSVETPDGGLVRFTSRFDQGPTPVLTSGRVEGDKLLLKVESTGKTIPSAIAWSSEFGGFFAPEISLLRKPMQPGETRTLRHLAPIFNEVVECKLIARRLEATKLLGEATKELLRIDAEIAIAGSPLRSTMWCDADGATLKTRFEAMGQETIRTTKEIAQASPTAGFDLGIATSVPAAGNVEGAHAAKQMRYRVQLEAGKDQVDDDPEKIFVSGPTQAVHRLGNGAAEITVRSISPGPPAVGPSATGQTTSDADKNPNNFIQSDDPLIVQMAEDAAGKETEPWKIALALEKYVRAAIRQVNFSQTFATAADVAKSREGDCTEHAVLLAALARAKGIPARVAIGLVYVEGQKVFGFHMWDEVFLNGQWVPIDATLGRGGIGCGHLKLSDSNLAGGEGYASFLPVVRVMGRLKIEALSDE